MKIQISSYYALISYPDLTLFHAEKWDLGKFDTTPFFIGYNEKRCRDKPLTVMGSFKGPDFRFEVSEEGNEVNMACHGGTAKVAVRYFWKEMPVVWWDGNKEKSLF